MICNLCNCVANWNITPDGWLAFSGAILGAFATIIAVIITIKYEKAKDKEDRIIASKPWITTDNELINNKKRLYELIENNVLYVFKNGKFFGTSKIIPSYLKNESNKFNQNECIIYYSFLNGGGNTATLLDIELNGQKLLPLFSLTTNKEQSWILILPSEENNIETRYTVTFNYGDIVSDTKYMQAETLIIKRDAHGVTLIQNENETINSPKEIGG